MISWDLADDKSILIQVIIITQANVDPDLCCHMVSLDHIELNQKNNVIYL